ncbi:23S rRNA pseudouridine1911/1915/1917 synthase [Bacillus pakistanensis]|uniref:Pseudouridine synthase n=1 Tax=Rossellomorea pakistanensis TaxID=992288 RepID=A0ABS2NER0_9BACI|nr:RluA family pseudouridine synthase [Bacillus pakistanensis]MBM7586341.1 23S rRNA pseudouridine1911/1915/1917 synthase [Bacillus pakistanensis]
MDKNEIATTFALHIPEKWENVTIEGLLRTKWKAPKKLVHSIRMEKGITVNGIHESWKKELTPGDILRFHGLYESNNDVTPVDHSIEVLYEDSHLLVVNKPFNMNTHPNSPGETNTLANGVAFHLQSNGERCRAQHIHRLDQDTTGAVIFAKHALSKSILDRLLAERKVKRTYLALVHGIVEKKSGVIDKSIGRDRHHNTRRRISPSGQTAITHFRVINADLIRKLTLVEIHLDTGRTHQIRVHMSAIGHPLAGDALYGGKSIFPRQALHARRIVFPHPLTEEKICCEAGFLDKTPIFNN